MVNPVNPPYSHEVFIQVDPGTDTPTSWRVLGGCGDILTLTVYVFRKAKLKNISGI